MYVCIVKFTVAVDCVCPRCCSVELAQRYIFPLLGTGPYWACRLEPLEPNVVERLDHLCIGMLCWSTAHILVY